MNDDLRYPEPDPNKRAAADVWNERYGKEGYLYGREPLPFLKHYVETLRPGKALDVAMGEGKNSVFLAERGFRVEGVDCSSKAVEKAKRLMAEKKAEAEFKTQNLDFFLMPLMKYDSIVMTYYRPHPRFFSEIRRGLVMGGTFLLEGFTVEHYKKHRERMPLLEFEECFKTNEVLQLLKDFQILYYRELPEGDSHLVQVIAMKVR